MFQCVQGAAWLPPLCAGHGRRRPPAFAFVWRRRAGSACLAVCGPSFVCFPCGAARCVQFLLLCDRCTNAAAWFHPYRQQFPMVSGFSSFRGMYSGNRAAHAWLQPFRGEARVTASVPAGPAAPIWPSPWRHACWRSSARGVPPSTGGAHMAEATPREKSKDRMPHVPDFLPSCDVCVYSFSLVLNTAVAKRVGKGRAHAGTSPLHVCPSGWRSRARRSGGGHGSRGRCLKYVRRVRSQAHALSLQLYRRPVSATRDCPLLFGVCAIRHNGTAVQYSTCFVDDARSCCRVRVSLLPVDPKQGSATEAGKGGPMQVPPL